VNEKGKVLDVHSAKDTENRQVIMWNRHNGLNQQWDIIYVSDYKGPAKKGEKSDKFGFYVERPFYIVSDMPRHRYIDCKGGRNIVINYPHGGKSQQWFFDMKTRTIKSVKYTNKSFDI